MPTKPRRTRAKSPRLPAFKPVFTKDQVFHMEADYNESWGVKRRLVMITLTRTPAQLAEGFATIEGEAFSELLGHFDDFRNHCKAGMELAEVARARILLVGMYVADTTEGTSA